MGFGKVGKHNVLVTKSGDDDNTMYTFSSNNATGLNAELKRLGLSPVQVDDTFKISRESLAKLDGAAAEELLAGLERIANLQVIDAVAKPVSPSR